MKKRFICLMMTVFLIAAQGANVMAAPIVYESYRIIIDQESLEEDNQEDTYQESAYPEENSDEDNSDQENSDEENFNGENYNEEYSDEDNFDIKESQIQTEAESETTELKQIVRTSTYIDGILAETKKEGSSEIISEEINQPNTSDDQITEVTSEELPEESFEEKPRVIEFRARRAEQMFAISAMLGVEMVPIVHPPMQNALGEYIVAYADQFVGNPYKYGGTSLTDGIDCSHFVYEVLKNCGVYDGAYATSSGWRTKGTPVASLEEAQAGDVICYSGHVAIYDGKGGIVEAKGSEWGITHDRAADYKTILAIRRFI